MRIDDGFPTLIEFTESDIFGTLLWEKSMTPPGIKGGGANDTSTMRNTRWRTMAAKKLKTLSEMTVTAAFDPACYEDLDEMMQVNQICRVHWPDGSALEFWGFLDEFTPNEVQEGEQPDADITVIPSNQNESGVEVAPAYNQSS